MSLEIIKSTVRGLASLAYEQNCLGCGQDNDSLCQDCAKRWTNEPSIIGGEIFLIFAKVPYDDLAARIVLLAKESGVRSAKDLLANALAESTLALLMALGLSEGRVGLVPIPSSRRTQARRGEDFLLELTKMTSKKLISQAPMFDFQTSEILKLKRHRRDQSELSERERESNLSGAFAVESKSQTPNYLLLLDDVITTGSTLREAYRALKERNLTVLGAVTACASQRRLLIR